MAEGGAGGGAVIPRATYRLQLHRGFDFAAATRVLPYLQRLGISHVYCSPLMQARAGSLHGYDIVAHDRINPELGGQGGFERFSDALRAHGMGLLLDMVPNHMGVLGADNAWWTDTLENGEMSPYAHHFDIEWHPVDRDLDGKVLLPVLGGQYGEVLDAGELGLAFEPDSGRFWLRYFEHRFPVDPRSVAAVLARAEALAPGVSAQAALSGIAAAFAALPASAPPPPAPAAPLIAARARDAARLKERLGRLAREQPGVARAIDAAVAAFNALDAPDARNALHALHEAQAYRLAHWRVAADEINYRRFFDINELAALRIEDEAVFEATHALALDLAAAGRVDGLRIDHPDGLHDPAQYFRRLQQGYARRAGVALADADAGGRPARPLYVVVEKITAAHEDVPADWPVHGTTGYRFATVLNGVLVDSSARERVDRVWRQFSGETLGFGDIAYAGKRAIMRGALAAELTVLATGLLRIARADRRTRDYSFNALRNALAEVAACMPVYRTYIVDTPSPQDQRYIDWAVAQARRRSRAADTSIFEMVRQSLLGHAHAGASPALQERTRRFAMRFQQFCSPVAAKGVEDTAFYRYGRLASLNEVGGDPGQFGITVRAFHGASADRAARWPHTILATSTHDNKRSEDVRNRIDVLSEMPATWRLALRRWNTFARAWRVKADDGERVPSASDEYLLYQTLLGSLPPGGLDETTLAPYRERIEAYMLKAAREAKAHTSWVSPNPGYEDALLGFVRGLLGRLQPNPALADLQALAQTLAWFGALNSLTTVLIKFTSPGVPDLYQGNEIMDLSLVDPDNRRPVDYALRERLLEELAGLLDTPDAAARIAALAATPEDGRLKLWATWRLLELRRSHHGLFSDGGYAALKASGAQAEHLIAYRREHAGRSLVVVAGRLFAGLRARPRRLPVGAAVWGDTRVALPRTPDGTRLDNVLTGERLHVERGGIDIAEVFARLPAAALVTVSD